VLPSGAQNNGGITVGYPPRNVGQPGPIFGVFDPGVVRLSTSFTSEAYSWGARTRTWQGFEKLLASKCGNYGTLLVGIDKDTRTAHWYAVGRANGTATVINHLSASGPSFKDPVYVRWGGTPGIDPLNGE
jgi:hypothetical protein